MDGLIVNKTSGPLTIIKKSHRYSQGKFPGCYTEQKREPPMSQMSQLSQELQELEAAAWEAATRLDFCLRAISDLHWGQSGDAPLFRATKATLEGLREIETLLAVPIGEIEAAG